ncbi:hypothetical protein I79_008829 [Cricetulus griseus]|uniref:Uncharacterized protein n=1 Tax=Cricetulus griseus TaxID=10029 RepID=G3HE55_CRIGR|nr:hypothetical protein I79_008829 [Cricetulus griseus]ERE72515.1 hypothetical protein H671_5g14975 [Cricetulus griseus]
MKDQPEADRGNWDMMTDAPMAKEAMERVNWEREDAQEMKTADLEKRHPRGLRCDLREEATLESTSKLRHSEFKTPMSVLDE